ncbi:hypothetical protein ERJ75_001100400 [Trypanosoma vivax]|nr:hypothetical protein ERJ75_001779900 [Trypanosoma vivax]KAH8610447.1 hypothetical protein ERJ75_001100400 [Trypanosoma vivax]
MAKPGERRVDIRGGGPVHIGEPFVLYHAATSQPARCTMKPQKTSLGFELEVNCSFAGDNFSRSIAAVTNHPENLFVIGTETHRARTNLTVASLRSRTEWCEWNATSMSCGSGLDILMSRIRQGALHFGGRLGFRVVSKALKAACREQRTTLVDRQKLLSSFRLMGVTIQPIDLDVIYKRFDHDENPLICAQEFLRALREDMPPNRLSAVVTAFQKLTVEGGGSVDYRDMLNMFKHNATHHPDVSDGTLTCERVISEFVNCWPDMNDTTTVTLDDFVAYCTDIFPAIESHERFAVMLENCWRIPETDDYKRGLSQTAWSLVCSNDAAQTVSRG